MKFNILKTRRGKLGEKIKSEMSKEKPNIEEILVYVDQYEKDNLETIEKLKRDKVLDTKRINGALKQSINAHGPITKLLIGSATKRIYGALLENHKKESKIKIVLKWIKNLLKYQSSTLTKL
jgi:hypothetical protein